MFSKKMITRIAQIAPLAVAMTFSLSPALARSRDASRLRHRRAPEVRVVSLTPANGQQPGSHIFTPTGSASGGSASTMPRLDVNGGTSGLPSMPGGATPGGGVIGGGPSRVGDRGARQESRLIDVEVPADPPSANVLGPARNGLSVNVYDGSGLRRRHFFPIDESTETAVELGGGIPQGDLSADEASPAGTGAMAARRGIQIPRALFPKIPQDPILANPSAFSRTRFAVEANEDGGLAASAGFTFGRH